jgi:hypothetical protein
VFSPPADAASKQATQQTAMERFIARASASPYNSGDSSWNREALYDRKIAGR